MFGYLALTYYINNKDVEMKKNRMKILQPTTLDAIKAMRRGGREAEMEMLGPGFHSHNRVYKSEKIYTRKIKHKREW
jgi:hypothetical protein